MRFFKNQVDKLQVFCLLQPNSLVQQQAPRFSQFPAEDFFFCLQHWLNILGINFLCCKLGIITVPKLIAWWSGLMSYMIVSKCYTQYASKFGKLSSGHRTGKKSVFIPIPKKGNDKECSNYHTITQDMCEDTHTSNLMFKIFQARLQQYMHWELPDVQTGFRKGRGTRDQIANIHWIIEKAKEFQKNTHFIEYAKVFDCVDHKKLWEIL